VQIDKDVDAINEREDRMLREVMRRRDQRKKNPDIVENVEVEKDDEAVLAAAAAAAGGEKDLDEDEEIDGDDVEDALLDQAELRLVEKGLRDIFNDD
jgi:hypothetical protein